MAMHRCDYAVTEAGFGADLGAEKFLDIKRRLAGHLSAGRRRRGGDGARAENARRPEKTELGAEISAALEERACPICCAMCPT